MSHSGGLFNAPKAVRGQTQKTFLSVIIPTTDRPGPLMDTLQSLADQSRQPDEVLVPYIKPEDLPAGVEQFPFVRAMQAPAGITRQRNVAMSALDQRCELLTLLDDDVELATDYLQKAERFLVEHPEYLAMVAWCVHHGNVSRDEARRILESAPAQELATPRVGLSGGATTIWRSVMARHLFDNRLSLYGYLEDRDFGERVRREGPVCDYRGCRFVHLHIPGGRMSPRRRGYMLVMNPFYLASKGTYPTGAAWKSLLRVMGGSMAMLGMKGRRREGAQRLQGALTASWRLATFRRDPEYIEKIPA